MPGLTEGIIQDALNRIAAQIQAKGVIDPSKFPLKVIIADIDYYYDQEEIMNLIEEAAEAVADDLELPQNFMNSNIRVFINHGSFDGVFSNSLAQGECIFQNDVFQIYAADYGYQFISKVDRMSNAVERGQEIQMKDHLDAAFYLQELIRIKFMGNNPTREQVVALYPSDGYMPNVHDEILDLIAQTYQERYGTAPFA